MRIFNKTLCILLLAAGAAIFLSPEIHTRLLDRKFRQAITAFDEAAGAAAAETAESGGGEAGGAGENPCGILVPSDALWESVQAYNIGLWENGQADFCDTWSASQATFPEGLDGDMFGYITIPAMNLEMPLYVGASAENLSKGAAVLGATSLPVGGENTNCVVAGHRGYRGVPYFREIEKLGIGDAVIITNPWMTLGYRVESIDIIDPGDSDRVMIREGRDMVTLLTCHPYRSHGKYRYIVYCVRDDSVLTEDGALSGGIGDALASSDGNEYGGSQADIDRERLFRYSCGAALILFFVICMFTGRQRNNK